MRTGERGTERASRGGIFDMIFGLYPHGRVKALCRLYRAVCCFTHRAEIHYILSSYCYSSVSFRKPYSDPGAGGRPARAAAEARATTVLPRSGFGLRGSRGAGYSTLCNVLNVQARLLTLAHVEARSRTYSTRRYLLHVS